MPTLIHTQWLAWLRASHTLRDEIDELHQKKKIVGDRLKPWADEALKLSQDIDLTVKKLN